VPPAPEPEDLGLRHPEARVAEALAGDEETAARRGRDLNAENERGAYHERTGDEPSLC
jgi:hypothetical protein